MPSIKVKNARVEARNAIERARAEVRYASGHAESARKSDLYTPEGAEEIAGGWVKEARGNAQTALENAEASVKVTRKAAERKLREANSVPDHERAAAQAVLAPVIAAATASDPKALVALYRNRAQSKADRLIIEDAVQATLDAGLGGVGFAEEWGRAKNAVAEQVQTPAEKQAAEDLAAVAGLDDYVATAKQLINDDLEGIESGGGFRFTVSGETARYVVNNYERGMDTGTLDAEYTGVRDASEFLQDDEPSGPSAEYPAHMTPEDTTGVPPSGSAARAEGETGDGGE